MFPTISSFFPLFRPKPEHRPFSGNSIGSAASWASDANGARAAREGVRIRWLGTAGYVIEGPHTTLLVDPYLTRAPLAQLALRTLSPDDSALRARVPARVDAILCGHSHFDHLLDAPRIAKMTGAKLVGSPTTSAFGRAEGLTNEQLITVPSTGSTLSIGDFEVIFVPSLHGRIVLGRVPFPGELDRAPRLPARAFDYVMGGAFGLLIRTPGLCIYHNGSADLVDAHLEGARADVLLVGIAGRRATRDYVARLTGLLKPKLVVPSHIDAFFSPLDLGVRLLPGIDIDGFVVEVKRSLSSARVITPLYDEALIVADGASEAFLT